MTRALTNFGYMQYNIIMGENPELRKSQEIEEEEYVSHIGQTEGSEVMIQGRKCRAVSSGYTEQQYFAHETKEKGPGPGWDTRLQYLEKIRENEGRTGLLDEPYFYFEEIEEDLKKNNREWLLQRIKVLGKKLSRKIPS